MSKVEELISEYQNDMHKNKYLGVTCNYIPEEIITAAGLIPYRIFGKKEPMPMADKHLQVSICGFARSCMEQGLRGDFSHLEGIVVPHTCDTLCKLYDVMRYNVPMDFYHQLNIPHKVYPKAPGFFKGELNDLISSLEEKFGCKITDQALKDAIKIHNKNRHLLQQLSDLVKDPMTPVKGSELLSLILTSMRLPKEKSNQLLEQAVDLIKAQEPKSKNDGARILISGGPLTDLRLLKMLEEMGAQIVYTDTCMGNRYFAGSVKESDAPLDDIAEYYIMKSVPCPCVYPGYRLGHLTNVSDTYGVQGVIFYSMKYCDTHLHTIPELQKDVVRNSKIPTLLIEDDHISEIDGQLRTRMQAFIETIEQKI